MKIKPAKVIENALEGKPCQFNGTDLTIGRAIATALFNSQSKKDPAGMLDCYQLAMDMNAEPEEYNLTNAQEELIKGALPGFFTPLVAGPILQHLKDASN